MPVERHRRNLTHSKGLYVTLDFKANNDLSAAKELALEDAAIFQLQRICEGAGGEHQRQGAYA